MWAGKNRIQYTSKSKKLRIWETHEKTNENGANFAEKEFQTSTDENLFSSFLR